MNKIIVVSGAVIRIENSHDIWRVLSIETEEYTDGFGNIEKITIIKIKNKDGRLEYIQEKEVTELRWSPVGYKFKGIQEPIF